MDKPILFLVDDEPDVLASLAAALERRFGADYRIVTDPSPASALGRLEGARDRGEEVALLVADQWMPEMTGIEWLARARELCPGASRCVLVSWGDPESDPLVRRALTLGRVDTYLLKPWGRPEDRLYPVVGELLGGRARLAQSPTEIWRIVGEQWAPRCHEMRDLSERIGIPYGFYAHDSDHGRRLLHEVGHAGRLPVVIFHDGRVLVDPTDGDLADMLGVRTEATNDLYDLVIVGAGPSGLAATVYGASEGLRTLAIEHLVPGGQAGTSSMIRNYLGFPRGIAGAELASRAYEQAVSFGAEFVFTREAVGLVASGEERIVRLAGGMEVRGRAVVIATGVSYNRLGAEGVPELVGKGVFYGAATSEAKALAGEEAFVVGAGNSAGQATVHLAQYAATVTMLVRGSSLTESMSDYLIRQIERIPNIRLRFQTQVVRAAGAHHLEAVDVEDLASGATERLSAAALFVLIGAGPHTSWLRGSVQRDERGYIVTGRSVNRSPAHAPAWPLDRDPLVLETSMPGVFAAGDVRLHSVKRVTSAVGEGAIAIQSIHDYLGQQ
jgi:thioredoxin reductase (NADPH)